MDPGAVGEASVDHRAGAVGPQAQRGDHALDEEVDARAVEDDPGAIEAAGALGPDGAGAVHQDVADERIGEQWFEGAEAADAGLDPGDHPGDFFRRQQRGFGAHQRRQRSLVERVVRDRGQHPAVDPGVQG